MLRILALLLLTFAFVPTAFATSMTLNVDNSGILMGASNVMVAGTPYDVEFVDGTCASVFGTCDVEHFITNDAAMATQFSQALFGQVFVDGSAGPFNSIPSYINGCDPNTRPSWRIVCSVYTPFGFILDVGMTEIRMSAALNEPPSWDPDEIHLTVGVMGFDTSTPGKETDSGRGVWARWSATSQAVDVPEPSSLLLLCCAALLAILKVSIQRHSLSQVQRTFHQ